MFSGLANQVTGWVANKANPQGEGEVDPNAVPQEQVAPEAAVAENGEPIEGAEGQPPGGMAGMAQGLLMKAMTAKEGIKEKASTFQPPNIQGIGGNLIGQVTNLIPGRREEDVPTPPEPNPPSEIGGEMLEEEQVPE